MIFAGCDVGSLTGKALILQDNEIKAYEIMRVRPRPEQTAHEVMAKTLNKAGLTFNDLAYCVSTGYGRERIPFAQSSISEISCHGRGAHWVNPQVRTIIDIGGQDLKVIRVDQFGYMADFIMNDKCAAGTGRFLENMAKVMGLSLDELGPLAFEATRPVGITKTCTVLAQFDVLCFLTDGEAKSDISAGIARAMAERISKMARRVGLRKEIAMTGGVAKNPAVVHSLQEVLGVQLYQMTKVDPQSIGALGAALFARERWERERKRAS
jgi:predicted CoA-substrate-specific enzyme activase